MDFEWDPRKARANLAKHGVSFERAREVWSDPLHEIVFDRAVEGELRWQAIGRVGSVVLLIVAHTYPEPELADRVRIVSARKATPHERRRYEGDE